MAGKQTTPAWPRPWHMNMSPPHGRCTADDSGSHHRQGRRQSVVARESVGRAPWLPVPLTSGRAVWPAEAWVPKIQNGQCAHAGAPAANGSTWRESCCRPRSWEPPPSDGRCGTRVLTQTDAVGGGPPDCPAEALPPTTVPHGSRRTRAPTLALPPLRESAPRRRSTGPRRRLIVDTRTTLLGALRERLGVTSPKKGCDHPVTPHHGQCGRRRDRGALAS